MISHHVRTKGCNVKPSRQVKTNPRQFFPHNRALRPGLAFYLPSSPLHIPSARCNDVHFPSPHLLQSFSHLQKALRQPGWFCGSSLETGV